MTDDQLIGETLAGDAQAFGQLVSKYQDRLYNTLICVTGGVEDARDVVQDAFVQAFLRLESFQRRAAFYTWLYRIAFNLAISRRRRHRPARSLDEMRQTVGEEPLDGSEPPEANLERQELADQVQGALALLSEEYRTILVLREMEGCCYETIAEMLDLPIGTVRSRLHRARLQIRDHLKQVLQEDRR